MIVRTFILVLLTLLQCVKADFTAETLTSILANISEDGRMGFCELAEKYGYRCIRYNVITEDGYILGIFNICGDRTKPVLLQHGFIDNSKSWLMRGQSSIAAFLANNTFDIWFGNMRGNSYSRAHKYLDPDCFEFWDFSFHEIAVYDMTAIIDFVLEITGQTKLPVIGHSEGTTVFFTLGSERPAYNNKIKNFIALAPVAYLRHAQKPLSPLLAVVGTLDPIAHGEFLGNTSVLTKLIRIVCTQGFVGDVTCGQVLTSLFFGSNPTQYEPEFLPTIFGSSPDGSSVKNGKHLLQGADLEAFRQYDHGPIQNYIKYRSYKPPVYNLSRCNMTHDFVLGSTDRLSVREDVDILIQELPNVKSVKVMEGWNHSDLIFGKFLYQLFGHLLYLLNKYD